VFAARQEHIEIAKTLQFRSSSFLLFSNQKHLLNILSQDQQKQKKVSFLQRDIGKLVVVKPTQC
jgi:hypothetical protein